MHKQIFLYSAHLALLLVSSLSHGLTSASVKEARRHPRTLEALDENGDTVLGQALKAGDRDLALDILNHGSLDVLHINAAGESYVYLAARAGFPDVIRVLADRRYNALGGISFFHFEDLDRPTLNGENAFFVAHDAAVLNELITQYVRGQKWYKGSYVRQINKQGENFLHAAARDNRVEVAAWATEYLCPDSKVRPGWSTVRFGLRAGGRVFGALQTYTWVGLIPMEGAMILNRRDKDNVTPLHVAVAHQSWETARALASCGWIDHDRNDVQGNRAVQTFLASLDPQKVYDEETHSTFHFLLAQNTSIRRWVTTPVDRVNHRNKNGDSTLHLAARLKDRYFYDAASEWGDVQALDRQRRSAADTRRLRDLEESAKEEPAVAPDAEAEKDAAPVQPK